MTSNEIIGFAGAIAFVAFIGLCLRTTTKWGAETRKREEEFEKASTVDIVDEEGQTLTIIRTPATEAQPVTPKTDGNTTVAA